MRLPKPEVLKIMLISAILLSLLPAVTHAGFIQDFTNGICAGTHNRIINQNGIIAPSPILGSGTTGVSTVIQDTVLIMLVVLMTMGILYMIGSVANLPGLMNTVKAEFVEAVGTGLIIAIFFGAFLAGTAFSGANSNLAYSGPSRGVFVQDCEMLTGTSVGLLPPYLSTKFASSVIGDTLASVNVTLMPSGFGIQLVPFAGLKQISQTLDWISGAFLGMMLALLVVSFFLGMVYYLVPLFLYAGIVLRAFPWTRAAGGIFISVFIGFYLVFPILLFASLNSFNTITVATDNGITANAIAQAQTLTSAQSYNTMINTFTSSTSAPSLTNFIVTLANVPISTIFGTNCASGTRFQCHGLINGFINVFIEPAALTLVGVAFAFVIALDFTDILADILGAPSLSSENLLGKLL